MPLSSVRVQKVLSESHVFTRMFPVPAYLGRPAVGINLSDYSIKHVLFQRRGGAIRMISHGKVDLPLGTIDRGEVKDAETLIKQLRRVREVGGYNYVHFALPEEHAYLFQITLPAGTPEDLASMLEFRLKEHVPMGADEVVYDYHTLSVAEGQVSLNVSVYPRGITEQYLSVLSQAGFCVLSCEIEGQATARALLSTEVKEPVLVLDIGRNESSLSISVEGTVTFTATLDIGGDVFTRAISRGLNLSFQEAELLKRKYGFRDTDASKDVYAQLYPVVQDFKEVIRKHIMYWHLHIGAQGEGGDVERVVLVGGNANVSGIAEYLEAELGVPVALGDVWVRVCDPEESLPDMPARESLEYATAIGLALRSVIRVV